MKIAAMFAQPSKPKRLALAQMDGAPACRRRSESLRLAIDRTLFSNPYLIRAAGSGEIDLSKIALDQPSESDRLADSKLP
jgi:hypothetical protein